MDNLHEEMIDSMKERFGFLRRVSSGLLTLYPLQLANVERLDKNDAVFIFDEVGCGKTISSGLMALSYLEQNPDKNVLVITINSLKRTGQFLNDWYHRLPFTEEQKKHIKVTNDHVTKIEKAGKENWGLVIVDEAQLFLADSVTGKGWALKQLKSEKVVFLTATPIRKDKRDIEEYIRLADSILQKERIMIAGSDCEKVIWREEIRRKLSDAMQGKEEIAENICAKFDTSLPVTRYFKDTVRFLEKTPDDAQFEPKNGAKRRFSQIWRIDEVASKNAMSKEECLFLNIQRCLDEKEGEKHHFVVFATKQQAEDLGRYFQARGFRDYYSGSRNQEDKTYWVITGENSEQLANFGKKNSAGNPTVLFVNYQVAEQGLNLPEYDYVVNFQISRFPSRLEQRFGRIDRLDNNGSDKQNINICYILSNTLFDTSTWNFYLAMDAYLEWILPFLPSRNMILSEEILSELSNVSEETKRRLQTILDKLEKGIELSSEEKEIITPKSKEREQDEEENDKPFNVPDNGPADENIKKWIRELEKMQTSQAHKVEYAREMGIIQETVFSDEIFVRYGDEKKIRTLTTMDCAEVIRTGDEYIKYSSLINRFPEICMEKDLHGRNVTRAINSYLVMAFALGDLNSVYPLDGYRRQMKRILQIQAQEYVEMADRICRDKDVPAEEDNSRRIRLQYAIRALRYSKDRWGDTDVIMGWEPIENLSDGDREYLIENAESFLLKLPIYTYLRDAGRALFIWNGERCDNGNLTRSWWSQKYDKWCNYFFEVINNTTYGYWRYYTEGENGWEPSPFLKLLYHYERCESSILQEHYGNDSVYHLFYSREKECKELLENFLDYIEMEDSEEKETAKKKVEERLQIVNGLNKAVKEWYSSKRTDRSGTSWYGQIFNESEGRKKKNWRIKDGYWYRDSKVIHINDIIWYASKDNFFGERLLGDLLRMKAIRKKLDYWSYNLIKEILGDYRFHYNSEIEKIYSDREPEYGFDFESIGITREILLGADKELANLVLYVISPWLKGF